MSFDLTTGEEVWRVQFASSAGSDAQSVTVAGGLVLVGGDGMFSGTACIFALGTADGSTQWTFRPDEHVYNFMPVVVGDSVLFLDLLGAMYRISLSDGTLQWKTPGIPNSFTTAGLAAGPNGLVYTDANTDRTSEGVLKALDITSGSVRWTRTFDTEASAAPAVGPFGQNRHVGVVLGLGHNAGGYAPQLHDVAGNVSAFDADTGEDLWSFQAPTRFLHGCAGCSRFGDSILDTWSNPAT